MVIPAKILALLFTAAGCMCAAMSLLLIAARA
jgi:hypothetical protein